MQHTVNKQGNGVISPTPEDCRMLDESAVLYLDTIKLLFLQQNYITSESCWKAQIKVILNVTRQQGQSQDLLARPVPRCGTLSIHCCQELAPCSAHMQPRRDAAKSPSPICTRSLPPRALEKLQGVATAWKTFTLVVHFLQIRTILLLAFEFTAEWHSRLFWHSLVSGNICYDFCV